ncbi:CU044_5270 family protein [Spirillospora sp. NPDC029432]|uniref:CU044_5270 family protein n=1 Tax=Spirillospora sp. NPDC029432 TaxID=3154599 RepID=UPI003451210E
MSRDVLRTLAEARPAELDPAAPVDPDTRAAELGRAMRAAPQRSKRRARVARPVWGGAGLVGVAAAATLVVTTMTGGGAGGGGAPGQAGEAPLDARTVLLAAAEKAEAAPATGKFWRVKRMYLIPVQVGPDARRYTVLDARIRETWLARNGTEWSGQRTAGARPRTPADEKAWRLDGTPARWNLGTGDTVDKAPVYVQTKPGPGRLVKMSGKLAMHVPIAGPKPTFADLENLPADPVKLRTLAEKRALSDGADGRLVATNEQARQAFAAGKLISLLTEAPVPPKVRAAAFRALAGMSIVKAEGKAVDARNRPGVAFTITVPGAGATTTSRLIIDQRTSLVLSEHVASKVKGAKGGKGGLGKERTTLYLGAGWTDQAPQAPSLP